MTQDSQEIPEPNCTRAGAHDASDEVRVDNLIADFFDETDEWLDEVAAQKEEIRRAKVEQALFGQGARDFLAGKIDTVLMANSDAYFQGQDYGRRIHDDIEKIARKKFPAAIDAERVKQFGSDLLKKSLKIEAM